MNAKVDRYQRQVLVPQIGTEGQARLQRGRVLLVGCGALGCVIADQLARGGAGSVRLIDRDFVERSNLHRQLLFDEADAVESVPKAIAAKRKLEAANSTVSIDAHIADFNANNAARLAKDVDVIVDGTDNFETRYLLNDLSVSRGLPYIYGGVVGTIGTQFTVLPRSPAGDRPWEHTGQATACLSCLWPHPPAPGKSATCDTAGVLGSAVAMVASTQAIETIKVLIGAWDQIDPVLRQFDAWTGQIRQIDTRAVIDENCPCCGQRQFEHLAGRRSAAAVSLCGRNAVQVQPATGGEAVDLDAIAAQLGRVGPVQRNAFTLRCALPCDAQPLELTLFADGRAIIKGTDEPAVARSLYSRYIGL